MTMNMNMIMVKFYSSMAAQPHHLDIGDEYDGDKMLTLHVSKSWCPKLLFFQIQLILILTWPKAPNPWGPPPPHIVYLAVKIMCTWPSKYEI